MTKWEEMLQTAGVVFVDSDELVNTSVLRTPIGYRDDGGIQRIEFSNTDVNSIVVGSSMEDVRNLCEVVCEGLKASYGGSCECKIHDTNSEFGANDGRIVSRGRRIMEERVSTDSEFVSLMYRIEEEVTYRIRLLSLMNCKSIFAWNDVLRGLIGQDMSDEQAYCLGYDDGVKWDNTFYMRNTVVIINGFLDALGTLNQSKSSTVDRLLNTVLKLGRVTGVHLMITGSSLSGLKKSFVDLFSLRILLHCSEMASMSLLGDLRASEVSDGEAVLLSSEMVRPILIKSVPTMLYSDEE